MGSNRRTYTSEFKLDAVRMVIDQGRAVTEVAEALGIDRSLLQSWKKKFATDGEVAFPGRGKLKPQDEEIRRLKRELAQVRQEREILKKALAYFAKERK
jgi:transposase